MSNFGASNETFALQVLPAIQRVKQFRLNARIKRTYSVEHQMQMQNFKTIGNRDLCTDSVEYLLTSTVTNSF